MADLSYPINILACEHYRRNARKALRDVYVERCQDPTWFLNEWVDLYANLIKKHNIKGILAFSRLTFGKQLRVPGIIALLAVYEESTVGMLLWYVQGEVDYYHLEAYNVKGYNMRVSFALFWFAFKYFTANELQ